MAVTADSVDDGHAAPRILWQLDDEKKFPRLEMVYADRKYENAMVKEWLAARVDPFRLEIVRRPEGTEEFVRLPRRRAVKAEPGAAGPGPSARRVLQAEDYERTPESSAAWVRISSIRGMLRRLAPDKKRPTVPFKYTQEKAVYIL